MSSLPAGRSAALVAHDEAAKKMEELLNHIGSLIGFWRPRFDSLLSDMRDAAQEIEDDVRLTRSLEDDE
jgi:hypothetical protein